MSCSLTDVALSSSLLCHNASSPTQGCCSDGTILLGGFGGPLNPNFTVSSVEYLGPEDEHPSPGRTARHCTEPTKQCSLKNNRQGWCIFLIFMKDQYWSVLIYWEQFNKIKPIWRTIDWLLCIWCHGKLLVWVYWIHFHAIYKDPEENCVSMDPIQIHQ